ncbi:DASH complex subunit Dad1, partial [Trichophaea hybrida]
SYFEQQRAHLLSEISLAMEHVLMNMNTLNRNFESIIAVGREFEAVEALWTQFEGVMGKTGK